MGFRRKNLQLQDLTPPTRLAPLLQLVHHTCSLRCGSFLDFLIGSELYIRLNQKKGTTMETIGNPRSTFRKQQQAELFRLFVLRL